MEHGAAHEVGEIRAEARPLRRAGRLVRRSQRPIGKRREGERHRAGDGKDAAPAERGQDHRGERDEHHLSHRAARRRDAEREAAALDEEARHRRRYDGIRDQAEAQSGERAVQDDVEPGAARQAHAQHADAERDQPGGEELARPVAVDQHAAEEVAGRHGDQRERRAARKEAARPAELRLHARHGELQQVAVRERRREHDKTDRDDGPANADFISRQAVLYHAAE